MSVNLSEASAELAVDDIGLPSLLPAASYLIGALSDPEMDVQDLPPVIEKSPTIAARIVALANSAWSAPVEPITSLNQACRRLGLNMVRTVGVAIAVSEPFRPATTPGFDRIRFWSSSLLAADAGFWLASPLPAHAQQTARSAALLARLGMLWLVEHRPVETIHAIDEVSSGLQPSLDIALKQSCGMGHVEVSQRLARFWQLPEVLCQAIGRQKVPDFSPDQEPVTVVVANATRMTHAVSHGLDFEPDQNFLPLLRVDTPLQLNAFEKLQGAAAAKRELAAAITG